MNLKDISTNNLINNLKNKSNKFNINIIPIKNVINLKNNKKTIKYINNTNKNNIYNNKKTPKILTNKTKNMKFINLNEHELNNLNYKNALLYDKRTYFQYYLSLVKKKQLILFIILPSNDYNLLSIKIILFLLSFSLYFTMNGLFFTDSTMHKIYVGNGEYNIVYQIPKLIYSTLISSVVNIILRWLSLTEKSILTIKNENNFKISLKRAKSTKNLIIIKFILFFMVSIIVLLFFWYFISCFCGVYKNTQIILIKDTLISFGMTMIYPFGLNLIPGIFRISALRAKKKDKDCIYKLSEIISQVV